MTEAIDLSTPDTLNWIDAPDGYHVALSDGKVICRNAKGKVLASVPPKVNKSEAVEQLNQLTEMLAEHQQTCSETVDSWMLRSLPVPTALIQSVWQDPYWRTPLENAIVATTGFDPQDPENADKIGFLLGTDPKKGVGIVNLDGETVWIDTPSVSIPHPALIPDLNDFRELASELGFTQGLSQLFREIYTPQPTQKSSPTAIKDFDGGHFEQLNFALGHCRKLGYRVRGGFACCPVFENNLTIEARFWIGSDYPESETETGELIWVDSTERPLPLSTIGPVAFSEGMRMATAIHAKATKETPE